MYEDFYGLTKKPFQITSDPGFLWMGKKHREALSTLKYGVMDNKGFLLLTGDVGTGKTTLINRLIQDIQDKAYTAKIPDPGLSKYDFYRMVSRYFKLPIDVRTKSDFLEPFSRFLNDAHEERKSVLLLIDEAQRLKHDLMEEIRLLSNLERQDSKLLNIFFVGQNEFNGILLQPENRALMRRITITYNLEPLDRAETCEYIRHRLKVAGAGYEIFSSAAMQEVYAFSSGFPRQINIICDLAMFFSSQIGSRTISRKVVSQCRERISFTVEESPAPTDPKPRREAPSVQYRPPVKARGRGSGPARTIAAAVVLLAMGCGLYLMPEHWKNRVGQGIQGTIRAVWPRPDQSAEKSAETPPPAADGADAADDVETIFAGRITDEAAVPMAAGPPLRVPRRPPAIGWVESGDVPSAAAAAETPDPSDAIDWLLEKKGRGSDR